VKERKDGITKSGEKESIDEFGKRLSSRV